MEQMQITSARYVNYMGETSCISAIINGQELSVPLDPSNRHYAEILRQVEEGTLTIADAE